VEVNNDCADNKYLLAIHSGDEDALAALMEKYYESLYNYASRFSIDKELIKDNIQEIFISLWQRRETSISILSVKYYLLRAIKNKMLKSISKSAKNKEFQAGEEVYDFYIEFSIEKKIIDKQVSEENIYNLKKILLQLSPKQKEVIYLKFFEHLNHAQVAELMGISRQSVYNLLHESIQKLRHLWHNEYDMQKISVRG
jgi:RNA polymerase sigma factor (sigma-70 family)